MISRLVVGIEREDLKFPDLPVLRKELMFYEAKRGPTGRLKYSAPGKSHDDAVISLALAYWGATKLYSMGRDEPVERQRAVWEGW